MKKRPSASPSRHRRRTDEAEKPKRRRRRCLNCGELFTPARDWQKFDKPECKVEFHRAGGVSFTRYSAIVENRVRKAERRIMHEIAERIDTITQKIMRKLREMKISEQARSQATEELAALAGAVRPAEQEERNATARPANQGAVTMREVTAPDTGDKSLS